jgi:hypothetical protein
MVARLPHRSSNGFPAALSVQKRKSTVEADFEAVDHYSPEAMLRRVGVLSVIGLVGLAFAPSATAATTSCPYTAGYPGDVAPLTQKAAWMASGALAAGLPGELPVMGALVESGLNNLSFGDADAVGYFQMRLGIWNQGQYAGYATNPDLQLKWFIDQAIAINQLRVATGLPPYGSDPNLWGEWDADVLRPAAQFRSRYQLRLVEASDLVAAGCAAAAGVPPPPPSPAPPITGPSTQTNAVAPVLKISAKRVQDAIDHGGIVVKASCPAEACSVQARGTIPLAGAARIYRIKSATRQLPRGGNTNLKLRLTARVRRALSQAFRKRKRIRSRITVTASDSAGRKTLVRSTVVLKH